MYKVQAETSNQAKVQGWTCTPRLSAALVLSLVLGTPASALDPHRAVTQYSRTVWSQRQGLPQDTIRAIAQTRDGFLWVGSDEGLTRFDGYEFVTYSRDRFDLPSNSITALASGPDGSLWAGTPAGLVQHQGGQFRKFTTKDGLASDSVSQLLVDRDGHLWIVAGGKLTEWDGRRFHDFSKMPGLEGHSIRGVTQDGAKNLYVVGYSMLARLNGSKAEILIDEAVLKNDFPQEVLVDRGGNLWIRGVRGLLRRTPDGQFSRLGPKEGLPGSFGLNSLMQDRDGNLWLGTRRGLLRLDVGPSGIHTASGNTNSGAIETVFEDLEGNLWTGGGDGLTRLRDDAFAVYGKAEGLPSDEPNAVYEDRAGRIWIGFLEDGFTQLGGAPVLTSGRIFSFHESRSGELLVGTREGLIRYKNGVISTYYAPDPLGRKSAYEALEASDGRLWLALPSGLGHLVNGKFTSVIRGGQLLESSFVTLAEGKDGEIWAGNYRGGLWRVKGDQVSHYTTAEGLASNEVRSLYYEANGTLWVATFGGGLSRFKDGKFTSFGVSQGLLSDNINRIVDDGESLWLSTTRGICRVSKRQLDTPGQRIQAQNFGIPDGLRSAESPPVLASGGGGRHADGSLWFVTGKGVAVFDPRSKHAVTSALQIHMLEMQTDTEVLPLSPAPQVPPGSHLRLRYSAIHLRAPEEVRYSYRLAGSDPDWISSGQNRTVDYNSLNRGKYQFAVRAELPGANTSEVIYEFEVLPRFYETVAFRALAVGLFGTIIWGVYRLRVRQVRDRFALVLEERARLAREVHDTLAQGFVGISSQLDAVAMSVPLSSPGRGALDLARRMARHSLTEARRSLMDLRTAALDDGNLAEALRSGVVMWATGSSATAEVEVAGEVGDLPEHVAHQVLRIAQEAVMNAVKHSGARKIRLMLAREMNKLDLRVADDGCGFDQNMAFLVQEGHFGLLGMRERAERLGGQLNLESTPGRGTLLSVSVPV